MADFSIFKKRYSKYLDTLKNTSYDKNNQEYLCLKEDKVINFEKLSLELNNNKGIKRIDALFCKENKLFLVEFKNQKPHYIEAKEIIKKFEDSINLLKDLFKNINIAFSDYKINLYLVMKDDTYKEHQERIKFRHAIMAHDDLKHFKSKFDSKRNFLAIYKKIFKESCKNE